jgi:phosphinothricin tripeptide acetyl hydrolase
MSASIKEIRAFLETVLPARDAPPFDVATLRAVMEAGASAKPMPAGWTHEAVSLGVSAERLSGPEAKPGRAILYLHGGGYAGGSPVSHRAQAAEIGAHAGAEVFVIDYRLAPEHPFPAALDDAVAAWRALMARGYAANSCAIAGDSAGGGLTVATAVALKELGLAPPSCLATISPWADLAQSGPSYATHATRDPMVRKEDLDLWSALYRGDAIAANDPRVSPIHADLTGLSPLLIQVGTEEVLLSDSDQLAARARDAGVDVTLEVAAQMIHVWHGFSAQLPEARGAIRRMGAWIAARLQDTSPEG